MSVQGGEHRRPGLGGAVVPQTQVGLDHAGKQPGKRNARTRCCGGGCAPNHVLPPLQHVSRLQGREAVSELAVAQAMTHEGGNNCPGSTTCDVNGCCSQSRLVMPPCKGPCRVPVVASVTLRVLDGLKVGETHQNASLQQRGVAPRCRLHRRARNDQPGFPWLKEAEFLADDRRQRKRRGRNGRAPHAVAPTNKCVLWLTTDTSSGREQLARWSCSDSL